MKNTTSNNTITPKIILLAILSAISVGACSSSSSSLAIQRTPLSTWAYANNNPKNSFEVYFDKKETSSPTLEFKCDQTSMEMGLENTKNKEFKKVEKDKEDSLIIENVYQGVDLSYQITEKGLKEEIIIKNPASIPSPVEFPFFLKINNGKLETQDNGTIVAFDKEGQQIFHIPRGWMKDSRGAISYDVKYNLTPQTDSANPASDQNTYLLTITVDQDWLKDPSRVYPITIDPSIEVGDLDSGRLIQEVTSQRARNAKTYDLGNGKYGWHGSVGSVHYQDEVRQWQEIDVTPQRVDNAQLDGWMVTQNSWHFALGKPGNKDDDGWVGFGGRQGANWLKFRLEKIGYLHWPTRSWQDIGGSPTYNRTKLTQNTNSMTIGPEGAESSVNTVGYTEWADLWQTPGDGATSVQWRVDGEKLKEDVTINQAAREWITANRPPNTTPSETYFGFVYELDVSDIPKWIKSSVLQDINTDFDDDDGTVKIELRDAMDRVLAFLPISYAYSQEDENGHQERITLRKRFWKAPDGKYYLLVGAKVPDLANLPAGDITFDPSPYSSDDPTEDGYITYNGSSYSRDKTTTVIDIGSFYVFSPCFVEETRILMADGSYKQASEIKIGDSVKYYDFDKSMLLDTKVTEIITTINQDWIIINEELKITPYHLLVKSNGYSVRADELKTGDILQGEEGSIRVSTLRSEHRTLKGINYRTETKYFFTNTFLTYDAPNNWRRGYVEWDVSSIAAGSAVVDTIFKYHGVTNEQDCHIHEMVGVQPSTENDDNTGNQNIYDE
ncbi:hypothetical protein KKE45_04185, partial [Patescibacteria group bacterium]|nr:hypothetical protein [Patescibacteria group bacterium]